MGLPASACRPHLPRAAAVALALALGACGSQLSTLPPGPSGAAGFVPLVRLARYPEVYIGAHTLTTVGTVTRVGGEELLLSGPGVRTKIAIYPARMAEPLRGRRVRVSGTLGVTFQTGYEIRMQTIAAIGESGARRR